MIGPALPPHLQKGAEQNEHASEAVSTEISTPSAPKAATTGPNLPHRVLAAREAKRKRKLEDEVPDDVEKTYTSSHPPKRPARSTTPPPLAIDDSESDDEIGPSISSMMTPSESMEYARQQAIERLSRTPPREKPAAPSESKLQRDAWMLAPPTQADWAGSLDASKLKARTFQQSRSGVLGQGKEVDNRLWTETPSERAQRLEEEALGKYPKKQVDSLEESRKAEDEKRARRIKDYNTQMRGPSLMDRHVGSQNIDHDDPSKRPFDYQKDIAGGQILGHQKRSEMISKAKDLDSKYSGGTYL